ncbi:MAG: SCP2 sterol-binding domain-containing protein [Rheinheimera sp.]|nr:SCP2 sterol-binding domain-containing protein [Rheinheimera sp.]
MSIEVPDLQMHYDLGLDAQRQFWLAAAGSSAQPGDGEVLFRANSTELLLLLSQQVDPDTLFFQRRLTILGDTELGLQLKNLLDTLEPDSLLPPALMLWLQEIAKTKPAAIQS